MLAFGNACPVSGHNQRHELLAAGGVNHGPRLRDLRGAELLVGRRRSSGAAESALRPAGPLHCQDIRVTLRL